MEQQTRAYLYAAASVLMWATVASAFKIALRHQTPTELLLYSALGATLCLASLAALQGRLAALARWRWADLGHSALLGLLNPCLYYLILFGAYDRLPAQEAQPLNFSWPIVLVVFSALFLGQRPGAIALPAMAVSFLGVVLIATRGDLLSWQVSDPVGVSLALASTVVWASYWILAVRDRHDPLLRLLLNFAFGTLWVAMYALSFESVQYPGAVGLCAALYVGLFEMGLTFFAWLRALQLSQSAALVSGLIFLTPFVSLVFIALVLGEAIRASSLMGLVLIVGGILLQRYGERALQRRRRRGA